MGGRSSRHSATLTIDRRRAGPTLDRRVLGLFIEHLGRCIYGGVFDENSPLSDGNGFRLDVLEAMRGLRPAVLRWPGGNFVSAYDWRDGIGPRDQRARRWDAAWQKEESNRFGTDEFIAYCAGLGAEPYICLNMGTGSLREAAAWLEYCNGSGRTAWADARRHNGHDSPYHVRYWGLGNEVYGSWQVGALSADDYITRAREWAKVLRWTDPDVELVACGESGWGNWDQAVVEGLAGFADWYSVHLYTGSSDFEDNVTEPHQVERALGILRSTIDRVRYVKGVERPLHVAYDEWNQWYGEARVGNGLEARYTLSDALAVGVYLNSFARNADIVRMANLAQAVNVIAPIVTNDSGLFLQTIYFPLQLFANHMIGTRLDAFVDGPTYELADPPKEAHRVADLGPFQVLDVAAVATSEGETSVSVVNRQRDHDVDARVELKSVPAGGRVHQFVVNGPDVDVVNSFEDSKVVGIRDHRWSFPGEAFEHRFPAHSMTVLRITHG